MSPVRRVLGAYAAAFAGLPRAVWLLAAAALVNRAGTMVLPFLSLYLTREIGLDVEAAGRLLALYGAGAIAGAFLGGWVADRLGSVRAQQISLVGSGAGFLWLAQLRHPGAIGVAMFLLAVVGEGYRPGLLAAAGELSPPTVRGRALGLVRLAINAGMSIGPAIGGLLAARHYGWLFVGDGLTCCAAAVVLALTLPGRPARALSHMSGKPVAAAVSPWRDGPFVAFLVLFVGLCVVYFQLNSTFPLYLRDVYGLAEPTIGGLIGINALVIVAVEMLVIRAAEGRPPLAVLSLGALVVGVGFALLPLGRSWQWAGVTVLVWTAGEMLSLPFSNIVAAGRAASSNIGRYMGAYGAVLGVAFLLAPAIGTTVYGSLGPDVLWYAIGVWGALLALGFRLLRPRFEAPAARAATPAPQPESPA